jgi:hypothetical protein
MYTAAVQALGVQDKIEVLDLAELVKRSMAPDGMDPDGRRGLSAAISAQA